MDAQIMLWALKMKALGGFGEPKAYPGRSKSVKNEILGALGDQSRVLGDQYGALGVKNGGPGWILEPIGGPLGVQ